MTGTQKTNSAWVHNPDLIHRSAELAAASGLDFERHVLSAIRMLWPTAIGARRLSAFDKSGIDLLVWSDTPPLPLVVQCKGFSNLNFGPAQFTQSLDVIQAFQRSGVSARVYLFIHNRVDVEGVFSDRIQDELQKLTQGGQVAEAELWDRERLVSKVHAKAIEPVLSAVQRFSDISPGANDALAYQRHVRDVLSLLFPLELRPLHLEQVIFGGLKRLDILAFNKSRAGFFHSLKQDHAIPSPVIAIECKNYRHDLGNPEFDQLGSRLGRKIGLFGILAYRHASERQTVIKRCQAFFDNDGRVILPLDDSDFAELLTLKIQSGDEAIEQYLGRILLEVKAGYVP